MKGHVKIRCVSRRDLASVALMVNEGRKQGGFLPHNPRCTAPSLAAYMRRMRSCFPYHMLVLEIEGNVQGYVDFCEMGGGVGHLIGIFVNQPNRRKGHAAKLVNQALRLLRKRRCHKVRSEVYITNRGAMLFSKRMGFFREGLFRDDEGHRDVVIWSKSIARR